MIYEVLPDRLTMYVNQAHNIHIKTSLNSELGAIYIVTDSVSWFFGITLAKNQDFFLTFSAPMSNFRTFQDFSGPLGTLCFNMFISRVTRGFSLFESY